MLKYGGGLVIYLRQKDGTTQVPLKRTARAVLTGMRYSVGSVMRHPPRQHITFFLKPVQASFHLCDTAGYLFGTTAEVHSAEFIQLRLQMVYFTLPGYSAFPEGRGSALPVRPGAVLAEGYRQKRCHS